MPPRRAPDNLIDQVGKASVLGRLPRSAASGRGFAEDNLESHLRDLGARTVVIPCKANPARSECCLNVCLSADVPVRSRTASG